jgi:DNA-binding XRE family transcriptional regulator
MTQHASLSPRRWAAFSLDQQLLMIANQMSRGASLMAPADRSSTSRRRRRGLTQAELAARLGIDEGTSIDLEGGPGRVSRRVLALAETFLAEPGLGG